MLAAFALPTLKRSTGSAIDWFSVFFFTALAIVIWVFYVGMMTGTPAKAAQRIAALLPGFEPHFSPALLVLAVARHRGVAGAGALAHGARAARAVEVAGAAGLGRGAELAAAADAGPAGDRLRAQLSPQVAGAVRGGRRAELHLGLALSRTHIAALRQRW